MRQSVLTFAWIDVETRYTCSYHIHSEHVAGRHAFESNFLLAPKSSLDITVVNRRRAMTNLMPAPDYPAIRDSQWFIENSLFASADECPTLSAIYHYFVLIHDDSRLSISSKNRFAGESRTRRIFSPHCSRTSRESRIRAPALLERNVRRERRIFWKVAGRFVTTREDVPNKNILHFFIHILQSIFIYKV